jgi:hypothetical protein
MTKDATTYYRNQIAAYTDAIRMSDFKANVAIIYGAFTIGPILAFSNKFPPFLPVPVVLLPFVIVFFCLLICLLPRYPREGRANFIIDQQQVLCVILCRILYWKTIYLRISFSIYVAGTVIVALFLGYSLF